MVMYIALRRFYKGPQVCSAIAVFFVFTVYVIHSHYHETQHSDGIGTINSHYQLLQQTDVKHNELHRGIKSVNESKFINKYIGIDDRDKFDRRNVDFLVERGFFQPESRSVSTTDKIILWYIPTRFHPRLAGLHPLRGCPNAPCRVTTNRVYHEKSDAVIFTAQLLKNKPPVKLPHQTWILHNHESPRWKITDTSAINSENWRSKFNWTMDYRGDSDIESPYGLFKQKDGVFAKRKPPVRRDYDEILGMKYSGGNATIAWMVSACRTSSKRGEYVREMQKYTKVDIFGRCGISCARSTDNECLSSLSKKYKFYLSFENAFCKDYITEKFFQYYKSDMVTVVRGGGNYSKVAPSGTYINAADFKSPRELAEHLNKLNRDDKQYVDILKEKDNYEPLIEAWPIVKGGKITYMTYHYDAVPMCQVCNRLWNVDKYNNYYEDIGKWFAGGICTYPNNLPVG